MVDDMAGAWAFCVAGGWAWMAVFGEFPCMVNIRPTRIRKLPDQPIFEVFSQGIQPYVLDGDALLAGWAELAAPLGLADMNPVGRPVTGARETVFFDKGFQQQRAVAIAVLPVPRKLPGRQPQYLGCEVV